MRTGAAAVAPPSGNGPAAAGPSLKLSTWQDKAELVRTLRAFEERRRRLFAERFQANERYWSSLRAILEESLHESAKVLAFFHLALEREREHAAGLVALPDQVQAVDSRAQEKRAEELEKKQKQRDKLRRRSSSSAAGSRAVVTAPAKPVAGGGAAGAKSGAKTPAKGESKAGDPAALYAAEPKSIGSLMTLAHEHSKALRLFVQQMDQELVQGHLVPAKAEFEAACVRIFSVGGLLIAALHKAEASVLSSFQRFTSVAREFERLGNHGVPGMPEGFESARAAALDSSSDPVLDARDLWLEEFRYRVAVGLLQVCWQQATGSLGALFSEAKGAEALRRQKVQLALRQYATAMASQYAGLSGPVTGLIAAAEGMRVEPSHVDADILAKMQEMVTEERAGATQSHTESGGSNQEVNEVLSSLRSPLESSLVKKAGVLQVKETGMMSRWVAHLAVATYDGFFFLFRVPTDFAARAAVRDWPSLEAAFPAVLPTPNLVVRNAPGKQTRSRSVESLGSQVDSDTVDESDVDDAIMPDASRLEAAKVMLLSNTTAEFKPSAKKNDSSFELTELVATHGVESMFKSSKKKKITLRGQTQDDMVDWVVVVREVSFLGHVKKAKEVAAAAHAQAHP